MKCCVRQEKCVDFTFGGRKNIIKRYKTKGQSSKTPKEIDFNDSFLTDEFLRDYLEDLQALTRE